MHFIKRQAYRYRRWWVSLRRCPSCSHEVMTDGKGAYWCKCGWSEGVSDSTLFIESEELFLPDPDQDHHVGLGG